MDHKALTVERSTDFSMGRGGFDLLLELLKMVRYRWPRRKEDLRFRIPFRIR